MTRELVSISEPRGVQRHNGSSGTVLAVVGTLLAVIVGCALGELAGGRIPALACSAPLAVVPVLIWRRPEIGFYVTLAATAVIEQFGYTVGPYNGAITDEIPFFRSLTPGSGVTPAEVLLVLTCGCFVLRRIRDRQPIFPRSQLARSIGVFLLLVLLFFVIGLVRNGDVKIAIWELRPWFYLAAMYVLGSAFLASKEAVRAVLWIYVVGSGAKAMYGIVIWLSVRHLYPRPDAVLAHEESYFFGLFALITIGLWLFSVSGPLRTVATALFPFVVFADMANSRREAWAILDCTIIVLLIITFVRVPSWRRLLCRMLVVLALVSAVYIPAYWNRDGTLAQPDRAIRSQIAPSARDQQSDLYRTEENENLELMIHNERSLGAGFGQAIAYVIPIANISSYDPAINYIPHNGILYVWMRMGLLGELAFWAVIASAIIAGCRLSAVADREVAFLGALVTCAAVAYVIMGQQDMGLFWFRIAFSFGALLGAVEAALSRFKTADSRGQQFEDEGRGHRGELAHSI